MQQHDRIYVAGEWTAASDSVGMLDVVDSFSERVIRRGGAPRTSIARWPRRARVRDRACGERRGGNAAAPSAPVSSGLSGADTEVRNYTFEEQLGSSLVVREPVGVVGCITPWNYPLLQALQKIAPALAVGCTVVPFELFPQLGSDVHRADTHARTASLAGPRRDARQATRRSVGPRRPERRDDAARTARVRRPARDVRDYIRKGIAEGATRVTGGEDDPDELASGYFVRPTIFADMSNDMTIAREEIFGPVPSILPYDDENEAVRIASDSPYGLSGAVWAGDAERVKAIARKLRTGQVFVNGGRGDPRAPFGGYKQSGIGRESGPYGLEEFLEIKSLQL